MPKTKTRPSTTTLAFERGQLLQALTQVLPASPGRGTALPVLTGVRVTRPEGADAAELAATDLELGIIAKVPCVGAGAADFIVPARLLRDVIQQAAGEVTVTAAVDDEGPHVMVAWARNSVRLAQLPLDEWPRLPTFDGDPAFSLTVDDIEKVRKVASFTSTDDARPILCGIYFDADKGVVAGTDSYRLITAKLATALPQSMLLPSRVASILPMRLLATEDAQVRFEGTGRWPRIEIQVGDLRIQTMLIEGEFPPYERLLQTTTPYAVRIDRVQAVRAIKTAKVVCRDATPVTIEPDRLADGVIELKGKGSELGRTTGEIDATIVEGDKNVPRVAFNPVYLQAALDVLTGDTVDLRIADPLKPMVIREDDYTVLLMPVRVS